MCEGVKIHVVDISPPEGANIIVAQSHFIKTVEDVYEALVESCPSIKFGIAFCESSGKRLIRHVGNDPELEEEAIERAKKLAAGHTLVILIRDAWPINVLNRLKSVSEIVNIFAATANPLQAIVAETSQGRGLLGVVDGLTPLGVEGDEDIRERKELLRKFGYKL